MLSHSCRKRAYTIQLASHIHCNSLTLTASPLVSSAALTHHHRLCSGEHVQWQPARAPGQHSPLQGTWAATTPAAVRRRRGRGKDDTPTAWLVFVGRGPSRTAVSKEREGMAVAHFVLLFRSSNRYSQNAQRARSVLKKKAVITIFVFFQPLSPSSVTSGGSGNTRWHMHL